MGMWSLVECDFLGHFASDGDWVSCCCGIVLLDVPSTVIESDSD